MGGGGGGFSGLKFQKGAFWRIWTKIYCLRSTVQKPACASQIVSHMWRLKIFWKTGSFGPWNRLGSIELFKQFTGQMFVVYSWQFQCQRRSHKFKLEKYYCLIQQRYLVYLKATRQHYHIANTAVRLYLFKILEGRWHSGNKLSNAAAAKKSNRIKIQAASIWQIYLGVNIITLTSVGYSIVIWHLIFGFQKNRNSLGGSDVGRRECACTSVSGFVWALWLTYTGLYKHNIALPWSCIRQKLNIKVYPASCRDTSCLGSINK